MESLIGSSHHSLAADFVTGWKLNSNHQKLKQFPLIFTNPKVDMLSKSLTSFGSHEPYRVVYMGPRHPSNMKAFKAYSQKAQRADVLVEQGQMYGVEGLRKFEFRHFNEKEKFFPIRASEYRLFTGMNPTVKRDDLRFESNFQGGNLDLAININAGEYDLLMRVDSNTKGHTSWFYFKVSNFTHRQKVTFNLINFQKNRLLFKEGMRPFCYRSSQREWMQDGSGIQFRPKKFRYNCDSDSPTVMSSLTFSYQFNKEDEFVYFAYCVPYSYSYLLHFLSKLQEQNPHFVKIDYQLESTGGIAVPLVTVTNFSTTSTKNVCLVTGRLHPGQTQGSWMVEGFLKFICSPAGYYLRQKIIFKIFPMVNVDGVVLGNFRTGIAGRDLNRVFYQPTDYNQIGYIRAIAEKECPFMFLDFHGHSAKKNVFFYGPDYSLDHKYYMPSRMFAKMIAKKTQAFRYYGCVFKISEGKVNTGRSVMLKEHGVAYVFTVEASALGYGQRGRQVCFNRKEYMSVGECIAQSLVNFFKLMFVLPKRLEMKMRRQQSLLQRQKGQDKYRDGEIKKGDRKQLSLSNLVGGVKFDMSEFVGEDAQILKEFLQNQKQIKRESDKTEQNMEGKEQASDSDFQQGNDYSEKQLHIMLHSQKKGVNFQKQQKQPKQKKKKFKSKKKREINNKSLTQKTLKQQMEDQNQKVIIIKNNKNKSPQKSEQKQLPERSRRMKKISSEAIYHDLRELESQANSQILNRVHYRNWRNSNSSNGNHLLHLECSFERLKFLNQVTLGASTNKRQLDYEPMREREMQRSKEREIEMLKRRLYRDKNKFAGPTLAPLRRVEPIVSIKQSLLPVLGRHGNGSMVDSSSLLGEILEQQERANKSSKRRNMKIHYL